MGTVLLNPVKRLINDPEAVKILTTTDKEGTHSIPVGSAYCPDNETIVLASIYMERSFRNLWQARNAGKDVSLLVVRPPTDSFEIICSVESFELSGGLVEEMKRRVGGVLTGVWRLRPEKITCQELGRWAGRRVDLVVSSKGVDARPAGGAHHLMNSQEMISPRIMGAERLTVDIHRYQPGGYCEPRTHQHLEHVWFVLSGEGMATVGDTQKEIGAGSLVYIPRGSLHEVRNTANDELVILFVNTTLGNTSDTESGKAERDEGAEGSVKDASHSRETNPDGLEKKRSGRS